MGIRSMNYIALRTDIVLTDIAAKYLRDTIESNDERGILMVFESNFAPMSSRDNKGQFCASDLREELAIQEFLGSLNLSDFYMTRAGAECGHRGTWIDHPFASEPIVQEIEAKYLRMSENGIKHDQTLPKTQEVIDYISAASKNLQTIVDAFKDLSGSDRVVVAGQLDAIAETLIMQSPWVANC